MENEVKQRNQRNRRRERAQRMQAQRESKVKDGDSGEDESPAREKPPRPPARRKKSKEPLAEEDIIDGFAIMAFRTYEDLEAAVKCASSPRTNALSTKPRLPLAALAADAARNHPPNNVNSHGITLLQDAGTSDDSGRASERLTGSSVAPRDPDSSRDRLSDCDSEGDDDKASPENSRNASPRYNDVSMDDASDAGSLFRVTGATAGGGGKNELVARGGSGGALALSRAPVGGSASPAPAPLPQPAPSPAPAALPPPALPPPPFRADTPHRPNGAHIPTIDGHAATQIPAKPVGAAGPDTPERPANNNNKLQPGARAAADSPTPAPPAPPAPSPLFPSHTAYQSQSHAAAALPDYRHTNHETRTDQPSEPLPPAPLDLQAQHPPRAPIVTGAVQPPRAPVSEARRPPTPPSAALPSVPTSFPSRVPGGGVPPSAAPHSTPSTIPSCLPSQPAGAAAGARPASPAAPVSRHYPPPIGSSHVNSSISSSIHGHALPYQSQASLQKHSVQSVYASRPSHLAPFCVPPATASQPTATHTSHTINSHSIANHATSHHHHHHHPLGAPAPLPLATSTPSHIAVPPSPALAPQPLPISNTVSSFTAISKPSSASLSMPPHLAPPPEPVTSHAEIVPSTSTVSSHSMPGAPPALDSRLVSTASEPPAPVRSDAAVVSSGLATNGFPPPAVYSAAAYPPLYAPYATTLQHSPYLPPAAASPRNTTDTRTSLSASPLVAPKTPKGVRPHTPGSTGAAGASLTSYSPRGPSPTRERESFSNISSLSRSTPASSAPVSVAPLAPSFVAPLPAPIPGPLSTGLVPSLGAPGGLVAAPTPTSAPAAPPLAHSLAPVPTVPSISSSAKPPAHWGVTRPTASERPSGFAPAPPLFGAPLAPPNPNPFSAESLFQTSPGADLLRRELDNRFLAVAGGAAGVPGVPSVPGVPAAPASSVRTEMHHHQHQHTHVHQHPPPAPHPHHPHHLLVPHPPLFKDVSKMSSLYRSGIGLGYPYSSSLLHPTSPYVPPAPLSYAPTKKTGKWNAMHVRIAWEIYNHQQKEKAGGASSAGGPAPTADKDKPRAFPGAGVAPPPSAYRSPYELAGAAYLPPHPHPHLGAVRYDERALPPPLPALHAADRGLRVAGVSPFARYPPGPYPPQPAPPPSFQLSAYGRELALSSYHSQLAPLHDPWRGATAVRPPPPAPLAAADAARRDHEERERRERRDREERERRDREERERRKAREQRDRELERARTRSPLRNGTLEPPKEERKEIARHTAPSLPAYGPPPPAWDPYRAFDPLHHMRFAPLVEAAIRAEEEHRAKMFSAYNHHHHQQLKAGGLVRGGPLGAHGLPLPPLAPPLAPLAPLDLLKKEEPR